MWTCPKCGRIIKRREQSHYCKNTPETIEQYIAKQPEGVRQYLKEVRDALRAALPEAVLEFSERLKEYKISKGGIQLLYSRAVPVELISDIARWCYETGNHLAEITELGPLPEAFEMEKIQFFDELPKAWTYPDIQPLLHIIAAAAIV